MKDYVHKRLVLPEGYSQRLIDEWQAAHKDEYYLISTSRERMSPALSRTRSYHLRRPSVAPGFIKQTTSAQHVLDCEDTNLYAQFPMIRELIDLVGKTYYQRPDGTPGWNHIGRVFVTELQGDADIGRHIDEGRYFEQLHRHHFVFISRDAHFCWDNDKAQLRTGELWVVNNSIPHWVTNGEGARTHLIFDAA